MVTINKGGQYHCSRSVVASGSGTAGDLGIILTIGSRGHVVSWEEGIDVVAVTHDRHVRDALRGGFFSALGGGFFGLFGALGGGFFGATVIVVVATIRIIKT
jgi:hypothetical protein